MDVIETTKKLIKYCSDTECDACKLNAKNLCIKFPYARRDYFRALKILTGETPKDDNINHPTHYTSGKFECFDVMTDTFGPDAVKDFCLCNAFKYLWRHKQKNGLEDIKKTRWYVDKYIELSKKDVVENE